MGMSNVVDEGVNAYFCHGRLCGMPNARGSSTRATSNALQFEWPNRSASEIQVDRVLCLVSNG